MYVHDIRGHQLWEDEGLQGERDSKAIREIIMFPLHAQSRCNTYVHIYDMIAEVKLFGGRKEPRGMGRGQIWVKSVF